MVSERERICALEFVMVLVAWSHVLVFSPSFYLGRTNIASLLASATLFTRLTRPKSCTDLAAANNGVVLTGLQTVYRIRNLNTALNVYCHLVDGRVFTSIPCTNLNGGSTCTTTSGHHQANTCRVSVKTSVLKSFFLLPLFLDINFFLNISVACRKTGTKLCRTVARTRTSL